MTGNIPFAAVNPLENPWAATPEEQLKNNAEQEAFEAEQRIDAACAWLMTQPQGKVIMDWLRRVRRASVFDPYTGFYDGAAIGYFREGQNSIPTAIEDRAARHNEGAR